MNLLVDSGGKGKGQKGFGRSSLSRDFQPDGTGVVYDQSFARNPTRSGLHLVGYREHCVYETWCPLHSSGLLGELGVDRL